MSEKEMRVTASSGGEHATSASVAQRERTGALTVPYANISTAENIATGFRQDMFSLDNSKGEVIAEVGSGAGWGSDFITLKWGEHQAAVRGVDLLRAWVHTFDPEGAKRIPPGLRRRRPKRKVRSKGEDT
jgi:hypothetical protein